MLGEGETGVLGMTSYREEGSRYVPKGKAWLKRSHSKALWLTLQGPLGLAKSFRDIPDRDIPGLSAPSTGLFLRKAPNVR